jgi:tellurite resistance protein
MDFFGDEIQISESEAEMFARGLYVVARAEGGVHEREEALIGAFLDDVATGSLSLSTLARMSSPTAKDIKEGLGGRPELARLFLKTCLLLAYVDGNYAIEERKVIVDFAIALGVNDKDLADLEQAVREYLLGHLVHLQNVDVARKVAKNLGL